MNKDTNESFNLFYLYFFIVQLTFVCYTARGSLYEQLHTLYGIIYEWIDLSELLYVF